MEEMYCNLITTSILLGIEGESFKVISKNLLEKLKTKQLINIAADYLAYQSASKIYQDHIADFNKNLKRFIENIYSDEFKVDYSARIGMKFNMEDMMGKNQNLLNCLEKTLDSIRNYMHNLQMVRRCAILAGEMELAETIDPQIMELSFE